MKFKVWDKVRCIEWIWDCLTEWRIYTITKDSNTNIAFIIDDYWEYNRFNESMFELVQEDKLPHEELEKSQTSKYLYQTQILRSDWLLFTKDKIGDELVSDIQARMNRDRSLLRKWKDLFGS